MNPFTALKDLSPFHFISLFFRLSYYSPLRFTLLCYPYPQLTSLHFTSLPFTFYFLPPSLPIAGFDFPNSRFENTRFTVGSPYRPFR